MKTILKELFVSFRWWSCAVVLMYVVSVVVCVSPPYRLRRRLRITSVVVCASLLSSFAHRLRPRLRIASVVVCAPPHRLRSVLICASPLHCLPSVLVTTSSPSTMMSSPRSFHFFDAAKSQYAISLCSNHSCVGFLLTSIAICLIWLLRIIVLLLALYWISMVETHKSSILDSFIMFNEENWVLLH